MSDQTVSAEFTPTGVRLSLGDPARRRCWGLRWGPSEMLPTPPVPQDERPGKVNVFVGEPADWKTDLPSYGAVAYSGVRPGLDLRVESRRHGFKYSVEAAPGADLDSLRWRYEGALSLEVIRDGAALRIRTGLGDLIEDGAVCWQVTEGGRVEIPARYEVTRAGEYALRLGAYDRSRALVIDPTLNWSTYLGGGQGWGNSTPSDTATSIARDASGFLYITGSTQCSDLPAGGSFDPDYSGFTDAFIAKIDPTGPSVVWAAYFGGSRSETAFSIAVDGNSDVFICGTTSSPDLPVPGAFDAAWSGTDDVFVAKISSDGTQLRWASYLGGSASEIGFALAVHPAGGIVVGGSTAADFPTFGGFQTSPGNGFLARITGTSSAALTWSSYVADSVHAVTVGADGAVYATGASGTSGLATAQAYDATLDGGVDVFVLKVYPGTATISWFTYLGGSASSLGEVGRVVRLDAVGNVLLAGKTNSGDFPTPNGFDTTFSANGDAFVAKLDSTGSTLLWATLLGGDGDEEALGLAVDAAGNVVVTGYTRSTDFPVPGGYQTARGAGMPDAFVSKISADGGSLHWSTYLGGQGQDESRGVVLDDAGNVYIAGETNSSDFPVPGGWDSSLAAPISGYPDAFVARLDASGATLAWASYFGGEAYSATDRAHDVTMGPDGHIYVTGFTYAVDFPVLGPYDGAYDFFSDVFVTKLHSSGSGPVWSTYVGGTGHEEGWGIGVGADGAVYVAGETTSTDFPKVNAFDSTVGVKEAFVLKLAPSGSSLLWSSYLGGSDAEEAGGLVVGPGGRIYVVGWTSSIDFPTPGGFDTSVTGVADAYVACILDAGPSLAWCTLLGGSQGDYAHAVAVDGAGQVYVAGQTISSDFPAVGGFQSSSGGDWDGFLVKINPLGPSIAWSSYLGGSQGDSVYAMTVDAPGNVYLTGETRSPNFPTPGGWDTTLSVSPDAYVTKVNSAGTSLAWSTFVGGNRDDYGGALAVAPEGHVVLAGTTASSDLPFSGALNTQSGFYYDCFVAGLSAADGSVEGSTYFGGRLSDEAYAVAMRGDGAIAIVGFTNSPDFPTPNGFDRGLGYEIDAFVVWITDLYSFQWTPPGPIPPGPPPVDLVVGGCGSLGVEGILLLALLGRLRSRSQGAPSAPRQP